MTPRVLASLGSLYVALGVLVPMALVAAPGRGGPHHVHPTIFEEAH